MSDKKTPLTFKAKVGDFEKEYEFVIGRFQIPGLGEFTPETALENEQVLAELIERKSSVIKEIGSINKAAEAAKKVEQELAKKKAAKEAEAAEAAKKAEELAKAEEEAKAAEAAEKATAEEKVSPKKKGGK